MMNLSDIFANAHGGEAMQTMARQFGLSAEQTQAAVNALLPAFSLGLQKQAESLDSLANIVGMFGQGEQAEAYEEPEKAASDDMMSAGTDFMNQIFGGSQEISQQMQQHVAQQAAAMTGIGTNILQQMMPMIASIIMGGLFKGAMNNGLGGLIGQIVQNSLGGMMGQTQQQQNPMGGMFGDMMGSIIGNMMGQSKPQPQATDPIGAGVDILKGMFETGQQMHSKQIDGLQNIFDQILKSQQR